MKRCYHLTEFPVGWETESLIRLAKAPEVMRREHDGAH